MRVPSCFWMRSATAAEAPAARNRSKLVSESVIAIVVIQIIRMSFRINDLYLHLKSTSYSNSSTFHVAILYAKMIFLKHTCT